MQKTAGWEKKEKKGQRCAGLPPFFIGEIWRAWGEGETFRGFDSGCGIEYNGKSCARPRRPPERGGARRRTGRSSQK